MTIQQHASFDSSAAELNATSKLVRAWESKNAKNAAKAGGISMMALSLAACGGSDATTTAVVADPVTPVTPVTPVNSSMTVGVDTLAGTSGADTFSGTAGGTTPTLTAGDALSGGEGSDLVLMVATGTANVNVAGIQLDSVETIRVADSTTGGNTVVNLAGQSGMTDLESFGSAQTGNLNFTNVATIADLNLSNTSGGGTTTITYTAATVAGAADIQNVALSSATQTGDVTIAGVETVAITASSDSSVALAVANASTVTIDAGATTTSVDLDAAVNSSITAVDASASTGAVTMTIDADLSADGITVTGGSGADTIDSSAGALAALDTIDGGAGTDTLRVQSSAATYASASIAADKATITNVEVLELEADNGANDTTFTIDMDLVEGVTSVVLDANDLDAANTFNLDDLSAAQASAISIQGAAGTSNGSTVNLDLKDGSGAADSASVVASVKAGNTITIGDDNGNIEALTVAMNGSVDATLAIAAGDFAGDTTADGSITVTGGAAGKTLTVSNAIVADTLDMSGVVSDTTVTIGTVDATVTGGSADDVITMTTSFDNSDTIDGGAGADILSLTQTSAVGTAVSISNVETLRLGGTGTSSMNMAGVSGITTIDLEVAASSTGTNTLLSLAGVTKVSIDADDNTAADNDYQALTISNGYTGTADALEVAINSDATNGMNGTGGLITANGVEALTISTTGGEDVLMAGFTSSTLSSVVVTANSDFAVTDTATLGTLTGGTKTITSFDSSGADVVVNTTVASLGDNATVTLGDGADVFSANGSAGAGIVITAGKGNDDITGSAQSDIIYGGAGDDTLGGNGGGDTFYGEAGADTITGSDAVDVIIGGAGNDIIDGGGKLDTYTGGTGVDTFKFGSVLDASTDMVTVTDFAIGAGGDILAFDESDVAGGIVDGISATATAIAIDAIGNHSAVDNSIVVVTGGTGYATDDAAVTALKGSDANAVDVLLVYFNTASSAAHIVATDSAANNTTNVHVATINTLDSVADMALLTSANFDVF